MRVDAVLATPHLTWLDSSAEKVRALGLAPTSTLPDACPFGLEDDGRLVVLYTATESSPDRFRVALRACASALLTAPRWTLRIAVQQTSPGVCATHHDVVHEELEQLFAGPPAVRLTEAWKRGDMRVESLALAHSYGHLSPLVDRDRRGRGGTPEGVERGEARGEDSRRRPRPLAWAPWPSRDRRMVL